MGFTDWFGLAIKRNKNVDVKKIKKENVDMGAMAAGSPSTASDALGRMIEQQNATTKILMVQDGDYMQQVTDYAMKMAQRLDCEIIALDVTDKPLQYSGDRKDRESERFSEMARKNAEQFTVQAASQGVKVEHIMDIDTPEKVIARISGADVGIRYVLSKPEGSTATAEQQRPHVPVFDLHCSRL
jgi:hypothetical protein